LIIVGAVGLVALVGYFILVLVESKKIATANLKINPNSDFSKDYEIDLEKRRGLLVGKLTNVDEHSKVESDETERGKLLFNQFRNSEQSKVTVKTNNELVNAAAIQFEGKMWCRLSTTVRCGGKEALAFLLSVDSRSLVSEHDLKLSEVVTENYRIAEKDKEENDKGHTQVVSILQSKVLSDGTEVQNSMNRRMTWKEVDGNLTLYSSPTTVLEERAPLSSLFGQRSQDFPTFQDMSVVATKITQVSETECKVSERSDEAHNKFRQLHHLRNNQLFFRLARSAQIEMVFDPIPKKRNTSAGSVQTKTKKELEDALPTNRDYNTLNRMQIKFQNWRKLESGLDESDGEAMGVMLMANSSNLLSKNRTKKMKEQRVKHFFEEFLAMKKMKIEHPFFETMIHTLIVGDKEEKGRHIEGKLAVLTVHDGNHLGASFLKFLNITATEEGAFASWVKKYPAMNELSTNHEFFKPLMLTLGKAIRTSATWQKLGLSIGVALMSMLDVATDIYTIAIYRSRGLHEKAYLMTVFVTLSIGLQLTMVVAVHHKNKRKLLIELFGTVTFTKPAFNKFRVLTNAKMEHHAIMPPVSEMVFFKMCEVFSESIPMSVIQVQNVLESEEIDLPVVGALLTSVVFVAEAVSYMTYALDISEDSR